MKIFIQTTDTVIFETLARLEFDVELCPEHATYRAVEANLNHGDLVFWDRIPLQGFYGSKAKVIVLGTSNSKREEFSAAKAGAHGFIYPDLPESIIAHAINCVAKGEIWMTRETIAKVFDEYSKLMEEEASKHR